MDSDGAVERPDPDPDPDPGPGTYEPTAESLARHELPQWWSDAKFGIFIHWGPGAVPAYAPPDIPGLQYAEWYWFFEQVDPTQWPDELPQEIAQAYPDAVAAYAAMRSRPELPQRTHHRETYGEKVTYDDFIALWKTPDWDPAAWVELVEETGAKYLVLTTKHHDGVALWPTATSDRNSVAMGPGRDIVGEVLAAASRTDLKLGVYYSMPEWFNPAPRPHDPVYATDLLLGQAFADRAAPRNSFTGEEVPYTGYKPVDDYATGHVIPQITELVDRYSPSILWLDIPGDGAYYRCDEWIADFYNKARVTNPDGVVVNDRAGTPAHADHRTVEYGMAGNPAASTDLPFEVCRGIGNAFGYNAEETEEHYLSTAALVAELIDTVSQGGNLLLNIGPRADGSIPEIQADRVRGIGAWLKVNGEAVYGSRAWSTTAAGDLRFTRGADGSVYVFCPAGSGPRLVVDARFAAGPHTVVELLGGDGTPLEWTDDGDRLTVTVPSRTGAGDGCAFVLRVHG
jgi:alpha-L-fucosidase